MNTTPVINAPLAFEVISLAEYAARSGNGGIRTGDGFLLLDRFNVRAVYKSRNEALAVVVEDREARALQHAEFAAAAERYARCFVESGDEDEAESARNEAEADWATAAAMWVEAAYARAECGS